jgi:hypothetical protein
MSDDTVYIPWVQTPIGEYIYLPPIKDGLVMWIVKKRYDGWYWYTTLRGERSSSFCGPFSSLDAAQADCEVAHR